MNQLKRLIFLTSVLSLLIACPSWAETQPVVTDNEEAQTTQTPSSAILQITEVRLNSTAEELEIILETEGSEQLQPVSRIEGNSYIADIPNAQLRLRSGNEFRAQNPTSDITEIDVISTTTNSIRVIVTGATTPPQVALFDSDEGLIFGVALTPTTSQADETIELLVTGEQDRYRVPEASTATRTDTPLRDIPQSIQIVPRQVIEDQKFIRLTDALRNVSGITQEGGFGGAADQLNIRGFYNDATFQDGFRDSNTSLRETANIERIEVLKGPASILFGNVQPGGIINLVTKKPLSEPYAFIDLSVGSFSFYRPSIDLSGPLNEEQTILYRLNLAYENAGSFRDFVNSERFFIASVLDFKIGDNTDLLVNFDYTYDIRTLDRGIPAFGRGVADIPISRFLGQPGDFIEQERYTIGYQLEHRFNENLILRNRFQFLSVNDVNENSEPESLNEETSDLLGRFVARENQNETYSLQTELVGNFSTGLLQHQLLFGIDLRRDVSTGFFTGIENAEIPNPRNPIINIFNPIYRNVRPDPSELTDFRFNASGITDSFGIFLQDQIAFSDNLKVLIGGRFDTVNQDNNDRIENVRTTQYDEAFSPRVGIVYQPIQPISLYASYSHSFAPNFGQTVGGELLEPERGTQYEVGIKADLNERLSATLALYQLSKTNIATTAPNNPDFVIPIGEQRSRGIELDISGEISSGWNVIASYGYTDAEITESTDIPIGTKPALVPEHKASLWTTYEIRQGNLDGVGFGLGLFYFSEKPGDLDNSFVLPSYLRTDAAIFYRRDNWRAAINIQNLFDTRYFESVNYGRVTVVPGAPFTVIGSFTIEF